MASKEIFPSGPDDNLLTPHFFSSDAVDAMKKALRTSSDTEVASLYERFCRLREQSIIAEIKQVCGIVQPKAIAISD